MDTGDGRQACGIAYQPALPAVTEDSQKSLPVRNIRVLVGTSPAARYPGPHPGGAHLVRTGEEGMIMEGRRLLMRGATLTMTMLALVSGRAASQPRPAFNGEWALEQVTRERWMHGHQQARFSPFTSDRHWVMVDSIRGDNAQRTLYLTVGRTMYGRDSALIVVGRDGHVAGLAIGRPPFARIGAGMPGDSTYWADMQRRGSGGGVTLAASRLWDVVPTPLPGMPRIGLAWTDTIERSARDGAFRQAMRGTRMSRVVGERVVDGHRLWIVRDSAAISYEEGYTEPEPTLDTDVTISRTATGTIRGVHLYDPDLRLSRERDDTTSLRGEAILAYPDGRTFHTPARYDRTRRWQLLDAQQYAARLAEQRTRSSARSSGGMVIVPAEGIQQRLAGGDIKARDSLVAAWQHSTDPDEASGLFETLLMWGGRDSASRARLEGRRVAAGDTAYLYELLSRRAYSRTPVDSGDVRRMLPFMSDPSLAWSFGLSRDWLYENLVQALTTWPRAAFDVSPARASVACTLAACRMLAAQWHSAHEPRLRDVGLVASMSVDPSRWADTVIALDGPGRPLLHSAAMLAQGVGATWPAAAKAPMPAAGSDWRAWLEWMDGRDPANVRWTAQSTLPGNFKRDTLPRVRFEESHATAVRFYQARSGRDVIAEWRRQYASAPSDSARLIFGSMLQGVGELALTEAEVADGFRSGDPARIPLARRGLESGMAGSSSLPDSAIALPIIERLLAAMVDSAPLWNVGAPGVQPVRRGHLTMLHAPHGRIFVNGAGIPASVQAAWSSRVTFLTPAEWEKRDLREAAVYYTIALRKWGAFVRADLAASERNARPPEQAPAVNASSTSYYLMQRDGSWVIVATDGWVT